MENKKPILEKKPEQRGVYTPPKEDFAIFWKRLTPLQRNQYIAMTVDLILADPDYLANPPKKVLSRDEWIKKLQEVSEVVLRLKG